MTHDDSTGAGFSRRQLFAFGGGSAALAVLLAACGGDDAAGPGVLGQPPTVTPLPTIDPDETVYLRTLASVELSIVAIYERLAEIDLGERETAALERFTADHRAAAERLNELAVEAGGEAYDCPNPWFDERFLDTLLPPIFGEAEASPAVEPSDNAERDARNVMYALESWEAASLGQFFGDLSARAEVATMVVTASRRAATVALLSNPGPAGYVSPVTVGEQPPLDPDLLPALFAIDGPFGPLTAVTVNVGVADENNLRFAVTLATPAENAFIGPDDSCAAP